jgi:hypothetical protein
MTTIGANELAVIYKFMVCRRYTFTPLRFAGFYEYAAVRSSHVRTNEKDNRFLLAIMMELILPCRLSLVIIFHTNNGLTTMA